MDKADGEWRKRLWACVVAGGGQFEHKLRAFLISDAPDFMKHDVVKFCSV